MSPATDRSCRATADGPPETHPTLVVPRPDVLAQAATPYRCDVDVAATEELLARHAGTFSF